VGFVVVALVVAVIAVACVVPEGRYVKIVFSPEQIETTANIVYGSAPDLVSGQPVTLKLDVYKPRTSDDPMPSGRAAIVWLYGGGFKTGSKAAVAGVAKEYAQRGYVTVTPNYRLDPDNDCQAIQHGSGGDPTRCRNAIIAAQHDAQASVRWIRAHADDLGVNPDKIAAGGFSAGAVTAVNLAYRSDDFGTSGNPGYDSRVQGAVAASGCEYEPASIGAGDAPVNIIASHGDNAVLYSCVDTTVTTARNAGLVAELHDYPGTLHAKKLYEANKAQTDSEWTSFFVRYLGLS
jgi:acetyl esterase/lipase